MWYRRFSCCCCSCFGWITETSVQSAPCRYTPTYCVAIWCQHHQLAGQHPKWKSFVSTVLSPDRQTLMWFNKGVFVFLAGNSILLLLYSVNWLWLARLNSAPCRHGTRTRREQCSSLNTGRLYFLHTNWLADVIMYVLLLWHCLGVAIRTGSLIYSGAL